MVFQFLPFQKYKCFNDSQLEFALVLIVYFVLFLSIFICDYCQLISVLHYLLLILSLNVK